MSSLEQFGKVPNRESRHVSLEQVGISGGDNVKPHSRHRPLGHPLDQPQRIGRPRQFVSVKPRNNGNLHARTWVADLDAPEGAPFGGGAEEGDARSPH